MRKNEQSEANSDVAKSSRRAFLYKSSAGAALISIPGKSVWGACSVSGALSGNQSSFSRHECERPPFTGGRSPGTWKANASENCHSVFPNNELLGGEKTAPRYLCCVNAITAFIDANSMFLDTRLLEGELLAAYPTGEIELRAALDQTTAVTTSKGFLFNLAGVYLNTFYGLYDSNILLLSEADRIAKANENVNAVIIYLVTSAVQGGGATVSFDFQFDTSNLSSPYVFNECSLMSSTSGSGKGGGKGGA